MAMASTSVATISLEASVEAWLRRAEAQERESQSQDFTIFRVPVYIRESNPTAFEPRMVSIGPYYHGYPSLRAMEDHKWRCLHSLLSGSSSLTLTSANLIEKMRSLEPRARACYSESPQLGSDEFVRMLLLDGCFILEFFFKRDMKEPDALCDVGWVRTLIHTDLLLLENQIPFFVLEELYKTIIVCEYRRKTLLDLILRFVSNEEPIARPSAMSRIDHLLHLYYQSFVPTHSSPTCREETTAATRRGIPCGKEMSATVVRPMKTAADRCTRTRFGRPPGSRPPGMAASVTVDVDQQPKEVPIDDYDDDDDGLMKVQAASVDIDQQPRVFSVFFQAASIPVDMKQQPTEMAATIRGIPCGKEMSATVVRPMKTAADGCTRTRFGRPPGSRPPGMAASVTVDIDRQPKEVPNDDDDDDGLMTLAASIPVDMKQQPKETAAATRRGKEMSATVVRLMKTAADRCISITQCCRRKRTMADIEQQQPQETAATTTRGIPCAKEMSAAGVTIVVRRPKEARHKYDVTFDGRRGVMEIPAMVVDDMTQRPLLMNLIAFEQTQPKALRSLVVTSYVTLMSMVIRRENDVELLRRAEILDNLLADDNEAARFFSHLADGVAMDYNNQRFAQLYKDVQVYCRSWRHRNRAVLMRDYFGSPWSAIAVVAAVLVFVLTGTQTYFTIFPAKG